MNEPVISVKNVGKAYRIWESPSARLTVPILVSIGQLLPHGSAARKWLQARAEKSYRDFWALREVSFEVRRGESVGIIGRNGSGKSTLLQIIAGTMQPTEGNVKVNGRVAALLELGSGFNPEFTGRENVYLNGAVLGLTRREIDARFDEIAAFADIDDFLDQPVKTYSSGMTMRLAFAVQSAVEPDILIVDEALSVGDFFFQQKCATRMRTLRERGTTVLLVTHDMASVRDLCQRALYLRQGKMVFCGESQEAIARYYNEGRSDPVVAESTPAAPTKRDNDEIIRQFQAVSLWWADRQEAPNGTATLRGVAILDEHGQPTTKLTLGQKAVFKVLFQARQDEDCHVVLEFKNHRDELVNSSSSYTCGLDPLHLKAGALAFFELTLDFNFEAGRYSCQAVLASSSIRPNRSGRLDVSPWLGPIEVHWDYENERAPFLGMFGPPAQARFLHDPAN